MRSRVMPYSLPIESSVRLSPFEVRPKRSERTRRERSGSSFKSSFVTVFGENESISVHIRRVCQEPMYVVIVITNVYAHVKLRSFPHKNPMSRGLFGIGTGGENGRIPSWPPPIPKCLRRISRWRKRFSRSEEHTSEL